MPPLKSPRSLTPSVMSGDGFLETTSRCRWPARRESDVPNNERHGPIRADPPPTRILFLGNPLLVERAVARASVPAAQLWQGGPETPGRLAGCPPLMTQLPDLSRCCAAAPQCAK